MLTDRKQLIVSIMVAAILMLTVSVSGGAFSSVPKQTTHHLTILATTDMHQHLMPYDYMSNQPINDYGFAKTYSLIEKVREKKKNTILLSNGDIISGSLISTIEAHVNPLKEGETQRIVEIYEKVGYRAAAIGNHELQDYKMNFFEKARQGAKFDWVSANVKVASNPDKTYTKPYTIINQKIDGKILEIGVIGFIPPQTMRWGSSYLEGNVVINDIIPTAKKYVPKLEKKADIVVALAHTGISTAEKGSYEARENAAYYLSKIDGIDAMVLGHDHGTFPGSYKDLPGINSKQGTINGVPAVMPKSWGGALGVIDLTLINQGEEWKVKSANPHLKVVNKSVKAHPQIKKLAKKIHDTTIAYVRKPIGESKRDITSYVSRIMDSSVTQIVNNAQMWWAKNKFAEGKYSDLPILSAAAPFQAGREDPEYFTEVWAGDITIGDVTGIYIYANQIRVMKLNGKQIISWLERSAENFNRIDPNTSGTQQLLNGDFSAYNYDVIDGIHYQIDVTKPKGERIVNATYKGQPLTGEQEFLVVTNNYRAGGGGNFPPCVKEDPVYAPSGVTNRGQIIDYIKAKGTINPEPTHNWSIKPIDVEGTVTFRSHPEAGKYIREHDIKGVEFLREDKNGMGVYKIDLSE